MGCCDECDSEILKRRTKLILIFLFVNSIFLAQTVLASKINIYFVLGLS